MYGFTIDNWIGFMKEQGLSDDEIAKQLLANEKDDDLDFFGWCVEKIVDEMEEE